MDVVTYLCSVSANPDLSDRVSPGSLCSRTKRSRRFDSGAFVCIQEQETPLHCAAWHGYSAVARALCQAGCHVDAKNREGETPLLTASARGFTDIVECLVEHRADVEATDKVRRCRQNVSG